MNETTQHPPLRAALVGCGNMGRGIMESMRALPEFTVAAGCDPAELSLSAFREQFPGAATYPDLGALLTADKPDVMVIATNNVTHAPLTIQAARAGVRGIYCEKPMAANYGDALDMVAACQASGTVLVVNHQRRLQPVFQTMRRLIAGGAIGQIELIRGSCAGDLLSDGTHTVDTVRHLLGDAPAHWVVGQLMRFPVDASLPRGMGYDVSGGYRYGHPVEDGTMAVVEFEGGVRAEIFTGRLQPRGRRYQDYEVVGSDGRLRRAGDGADPALLIQTDGAWRAAELDDVPGEDPIAHSLSLFARTIHHGEPHPMSGETGLRDQEIVMAIYESARRRARVDLPLDERRFPLEVLLAEGALS